VPRYQAPSAVCATRREGNDVNLTTHCALCGEKLPTIPSGLAPAWCGYDLGPEYDKGDQLDKLCPCTKRGELKETT
jgi:hypothetical protein